MFQKAAAARSTQPLTDSSMGEIAVIVPVVRRLVAAQFTADRRGCPAELQGNLTHAKTVTARRRDALMLQKRQKTL